MATITLTIPDAALPRLVDALCALGGWEADSPIARGAFARGVLIAWARDQVVAHEARLARQAAEQEASTKARVEVVIT
jgi:hypothetical protein